MRFCFYVVVVFLFIGCGPSRKLSDQSNNENINSLKFIGEYILPGQIHFKETIVGGLSGIDYDKKRDIYYMISDDPSTKGPTRFYTATIAIRESGIDSVHIVNMTPLLNTGGKTYADITKDRIHSADVEAMRYDPKRDELIWSSEGQRYIRDGKQELEDPQIVLMDRNGNYKDSFELPANMHIQAIEKGPRHNSVFEGISYDKDYSHVYVSVEEPIYEDGPRAGGGDSTAVIRILKFNRKLKQCVAQYAYPIDAVPNPANPPGAFKINGVSDILYLGHEKFIVIERGYSTGRVPSDIRIYLADASGADDISGLSLSDSPQVRKMTKKLLIDFNSLGRFIDNIEGVTFGPKLPDGHASMIFVADDNFAPNQKSQFLLFEVLP